MRRTRGGTGEAELRARIFLGATFIKNTTGGYTRAPTANEEGCIIEDVNAGGTGERRDILRAMADWEGEDGPEDPIFCRQPFLSLGAMRFRAASSYRGLGD